jgi:predicted nucleic acid-binding protein
VTAAPVYLDSSALIKLVFEEPESAALERFLIEWPVRASSWLTRVEVLRTARTVRDAIVVRHADDVLAAVDLIAPDARLLVEATELEPFSLRTFHAVHLATALSLQPDLAGVVAYDRRLSDAARAAGLTVWAPA